MSASLQTQMTNLKRQIETHISIVKSQRTSQISNLKRQILNLRSQILNLKSQIDEIYVRK